MNEGETINIQYCYDLDSEEFKKVVDNNKKTDIMCKTTTRGPQRDDINISFNGIAAATFASQGQIRIAILGIKLAIYELFSAINDNIIVILDDVFSELDNNRQMFLMNYIKKVGQVFITTTDVDKLPIELIKESNIIKVKKG